jgi:hypothetical protein
MEHDNHEVDDHDHHGSHEHVHAPKDFGPMFAIATALNIGLVAIQIFGSSRILVGEIEWPNVRNACGIWFSAAFVSLKTRHVFRR